MIIGIISFAMFIIGILNNAISISYQNAAVIDLNNGNAVLETDDGNLWEIEDDRLDIGDNVTVKFNGHRTETVIDDTILNIYVERK